jgi:hypothetical protein
MAEGGGLRAQKQCEFKPLLMAPQSHAHIASNPRAARGRPLGTKPRPDLKGSVNKRKDWWLKPRLTQ